MRAHSRARGHVLERWVRASTAYTHIIVLHFLLHSQYPPQPLIPQDGAFRKYLKDAGPGAEEELYAALAALVEKTKNAVVTQRPEHCDKLATLMMLSDKHNKRVQHVFRAFAESCDAEYDEGRLGD